MIECKQIYVVEDDALVAETLSLILGQSGYDTIVYADAESAFQAVTEAAPDMVISDVLLSGRMTGLDLAEKLANHAPSVKVILMSGLAGMSGRANRQVLSETSLRVLAKPILPGLLLGEIARALPCA